MPITTQGNTLLLIGDVGDLSDFGGWGDEDYFTHGEVLDALARIGSRRKVTVRLNSGGGIATEGAAIYAALTAHTGGCDVLVEGIAASAASVIAMAGQRVTMALGAILMLHEASTVTVGTAADHEKVVRGLEAINASTASIYAKRSGKPVDEIRELMAAETWFTPEDAVAANFADDVAGAEKAPTAFAYAKAYRHPPAHLRAIQPTARRAPPSAPVPEPKIPDPSPKPGPEPVVVDMNCPADPAEIADLCVAAGQPDLMAVLVRDKASLADVTARLDVRGSLKALVSVAKMGGQIVTPEVEAEITSGRLTQAQARDLLFENWAAESEKTLCDNTKRTGNGSVDARTTGRMSMMKLVDEKYGAGAVAKFKEKFHVGK